jgi:uncharacterized protein YjiS (DUF1127 family)
MADHASSNSNFFSWLEISAKIKASLSMKQTLVSSLVGLVLEKSNRKQLKALLHATPEHLFDIGIDRNDLQHALQLPLDQSAADWLKKNTARLKP